MIGTRAQEPSPERRPHKVTLLALTTGLLAMGSAVGTTALPASAAPKAGLGHIGGTVTVWSEWTGDEQTDFLKALAPFEKETGIKVEYRGNSSTEATALEAAVAGGKGPDVGLSPEPSTLTELASKHDLKPIASVIGNEAKDYSSAWNSLGSYKGTLYGVWYKAANKNTIWYNPAEFAAAGIKSTPKTWQQLVTDAATLHAAGVTPFALCTDVGWPVADLFQNVYLKTAGPVQYNKLTKHTIPWTSPSVTTTFDEMAQIIGNPSYLLGGTSGALSASLGDYPECVDQVFPKPGTMPKAAMVIEADFVVSEVVGNSKNYKPGTKYPGGKACTANPAQTPCYDFFPFPAPAGADQANNSAIQVAGDVAMLINPTPQAKALIKYLASPKPAEIWARIGGYTSPNTAVPLSTYPDAVTRADAKNLASAKASVFSLDDQQGSWEDSMWADMDNFVKNPKASNIKAIEATMQKQATAALGH